MFVGKRLASIYLSLRSSDPNMDPPILELLTWDLPRVLFYISSIDIAASTTLWWITRQLHCV
ncbi:hypothetical protein Zm00014a_026128 [Zea mays]|uniref:Uncharacterized protein n=1 Tax=Zea mays TaxID=4577 RepID=A0A3L6FK24_MAIZE|nr:hypothetical protein Zm00014a_026128 [Zea mays]